jgi:hypothetical protein
MVKNIYIGSLPRSGSTLLAMMLDQHSMLFNMGESFYWPHYISNNTICTCGIVGCPILENIYKRMKTDTQILKIGIFLQRHWEKIEIKSSQIDNYNHIRQISACCDSFERIAKYFRSELNEKIMIEKSCDVIFIPELLKRKQWKILLLIRDPRGIFNSFRKADRRHGFSRNREQIIAHFYKFISTVNLISESSKVMILKYEELCSNPNATIIRISRFLEIEMEANMLDFKHKIGHAVMGNRMRFNKLENITDDMSWKIELKNTDLEYLERDSIISNFYSNHDYIF